MNDFQDNSEEYLKVIKSVGEEVFSVLSNVKMLLRYALLSITESIRNNPEIYNLIFYNMSPSITDYSGSSSQNYAASYTYGPDQQQKSSPNYNTEANAAVIIDEAEKLFYKLVKDSINKVITNSSFSKSSLLPSSLPLLSPSKEEQQSHVKSSPTAANQNHAYRKEYTFIHSKEIDNEGQENKSC
jgi:hypothetical protein